MKENFTLCPLPLRVILHMSQRKLSHTDDAFPSLLAFAVCSRPTRIVLSGNPTPPHAQIQGILILNNQESPIVTSPSLKLPSIHRAMPKLHPCAAAWQPRSHCAEPVTNPPTTRFPNLRPRTYPETSPAIRTAWPCSRRGWQGFESLTAASPQMRLIS